MPFALSADTNVMVSSWPAHQPLEGAHQASQAGTLRNVSTQLLAFFRSQGCGPGLAEDLSQKVVQDLSTRLRDVLAGPDVTPAAIPGEIKIGDLKLDLERHLFWRGDDEGHLSPKEFDLLALPMKIEKDPSNPEYILNEPWIGYRFRNPDCPASPAILRDEQ